MKTKLLIHFTIASILIIVGLQSCLKSTPSDVLDNEPIENTAVVYENADENYQEYCASCHGQNASGLADPSLWKYGTDRKSIVDIIKHGNEDDGMPAYDVTFTAQQIEDLADYILEQQIEVEEERAISANHETSKLYEHQSLNVRLELVTDEINEPWGIAQSNNGTIFITDKPGDVSMITTDGTITEITGVPQVRNAGQGGLMDVVLHPDFDNNQTMYLTYSKQNPANSGQSTTAVYKAQLDGNQLVNGSDIFIAVPYESTRHHFGSRMVFDNEGYIFLTVGDRGKRDSHPQTLNNSCGKVHRIFDDGSIPEDNPFSSEAGAVSSTYSYGHRNPQGICYDPASNRLYENEHGPKGGDEINLVEPGKNYGWPVISYGINYNGTTFTDITAKEGMEQPIRYWVPSIAACGMSFITSDRYPEWRGDIMNGSLKFNYVVRADLNSNGSYVEDEIILEDIGRVRSMVQGSDGYLYVGVESPGKVFRIMPER